MKAQGFFTDGPVRTEEDFFGRTAETERVLRLLRRGQNVSIVGPRRIGKSSLLHHISRPSVFEAHRLTRARHRFVYICCYELANLTPSEFHTEIVRRVKQEIPEVIPLLPSDVAGSAPTPEYCSEYYRRFFREVERAGLRCIIMLDDFESIIENAQLDRDSLGLLRSMNSMHQVLYVIASIEPLSVLEARRLGQWHQIDISPFFNIFSRHDLGPFGQDESRAFLQQHFEHGSLPVPNSVLDLILRWAQGHPYYLQSAGAFVVGLLNNRQGEWDEHLIQQLQDYLASFPQAERYLRKESL
jgi:hypothetical protein